MAPELFRIIDANFNRSREALRVLEEYARFALDDRSATEALKLLRHELTEAVGGLLPAEQRLAARDAAGDVGAEVTVPAELRRPDMGAVLDAAAGRLAESLRVLEEYGKVIEPAVATRFEACRYRCYEIGQKLAFAGRRHRRMGEARLYVLVTEALCRGDWLRTVEQVARAGADVIQLREKGLPDGELLRRADQAAEVCRENDTLLVVNDRPDIAKLCRADGVHLGQGDLPASAARRIVGPEMLVGLSTHNRRQLAEAVKQRPDYLAVGPMFASPTKPQACLAGPELLAHALAQTDLPVVAIGGITADNVDQLRPARACCIAVCSAVLAHPDPPRAVANILSAIKGG
jgi:thiamine-phosphate pyrophosphorylase